MNILIEQLKCIGICCCVSSLFLDCILYADDQWLICKNISVGTPSAEGARIEAPQAPRGVGCGEGVSPSPPGEGSGEGAYLGRGLCPLPRKILKFSSQNGEFWCNMKCYLQRFTACFYTQIKTSTAHSTLTIILFTPICLTYSFWSVKPAAYGF